MQRIRVVHVIARTNVGGPAHLVSHLLDRLDPDAFDVRLLAGRVGPGEADHFGVRGQHHPGQLVPGLGPSVSGVGDARALRSIVATLRRVRPHIVHTHTAKAGVLGRVAARISGVALTVHSFHGHLLHGYFAAPVTAAVRRTESALARRTTRLVAVGERVRDDLLAAGVGQPDQYVVIPPGVETPVLPERSAARDALGLDRSAPVVVFGGRLAAIKRPDRLLAACATVAKDRPDVQVVIAGDGPQREDLERRAAHLGLTVRFLGWQADMGPLFAAADVAVLTSDNEGMPLFLVEAALAGLPAVTTDAGSSAEVVGDGRTGFVVPPNPDAVAAALSQLLSDPDLRRRCGAAAREEAERRFSVDRYVAATARLYRSMLRGAEGGSVVNWGP